MIDNMSGKIIGATVGMGLPKPNLMQDNPLKGDYVKGRAEFIAEAQKYRGNTIYYIGEEVEFPVDGEVVYSARPDSLSDDGRGVKEGDFIISSNNVVCKVTGVSSNYVSYEPIGKIGSQDAVIIPYATDVSYSAAEVFDLINSGVPVYVAKGAEYYKPILVAPSRIEYGYHMISGTEEDGYWLDFHMVTHSGNQLVNYRYKRLNSKGLCIYKDGALADVYDGTEDVFVDIPSDKHINELIDKKVVSGGSISHSWNGTVLTITSASGTSSVDLKGDSAGIEWDDEIEIAKDVQVVSTGTTGTIETVGYSEGNDIKAGDVLIVHFDGDKRIYTLVESGNGYFFASDETYTVSVRDMPDGRQSVNVGTPPGEHTVSVYLESRLNARPGQIVAVSEVDEKGNPISFKTVDGGEVSGGGSSIFVVRLDDNYVADKTNEEIYEAFLAGIPGYLLITAMVEDGGIELVLHPVSITSNYAAFMAVFDGSAISVIITPDGVTPKVTPIANAESLDMMWGRVENIEKNYQTKAQVEAIVDTALEGFDVPGGSGGYPETLNVITLATGVIASGQAANVGFDTGLTYADFKDYDWFEICLHGTSDVGAPAFSFYNWERPELWRRFGFGTGRCKILLKKIAKNIYEGFACNGNISPFKIDTYSSDVNYTLPRSRVTMGLKWADTDKLYIIANKDTTADINFTVTGINFA